MRRILLTFLVWVPVLGGCQLMSDNRALVHLYPDGAEPSKSSRIERILEENGYRVVIRADTSPYRGHGNTLIYGGGPEGLFEAHKIIAQLEAEAVLIANVFERKAQNHHYTERNVGLYLDSGPSGRQTTVDLEADPLSVEDVEFEARGCDQDYIAHFDRDGSAVFYSATGKLLEKVAWKLIDAHKLRVLGGQDNRYEIVASNQEYEGGVKRTISLLPQDYYRLPYGCVYSGWLVERTKFDTDQRRQP